MVDGAAREPRLDELLPLSMAASCENLRLDDPINASVPSRELRRDSGSWAELLEPRLTLPVDPSTWPAAVVSVLLGVVSKLRFRSATWLNDEEREAGRLNAELVRVAVPSSDAGEPDTSLLFSVALRFLQALITFWR